MTKRKGVVKVTKEFYENEWPTVCQIFKHFRPSHIEFRHWENDVWYFFGTSEFFDELKEGEATPEYLAIFTSDGKVPHAGIFSNFQRV